MGCMIRPLLVTGAGTGVQHSTGNRNPIRKDIENCTVYSLRPKRTMRLLRIGNPISRIPIQLQQIAVPVKNRTIRFRRIRTPGIVSHILNI